MSSKVSNELLEHAESGEEDLWRLPGEASGDTDIFERVCTDFVHLFAVVLGAIARRNGKLQPRTTWVISITPRSTVDESFVDPKEPREDARRWPHPLVLAGSRAFAESCRPLTMDCSTAF